MRDPSAANHREIEGADPLDREADTTTDHQAAHQPDQVVDRVDLGEVAVQERVLAELIDHRGTELPECATGDGAAERVNMISQLCLFLSGKLGVDRSHAGDHPLNGFRPGLAPPLFWEKTRIGAQVDELAESVKSPLWRSVKFHSSLLVPAARTAARPCPEEAAPHGGLAGRE